MIFRSCRLLLFPLFLRVPIVLIALDGREFREITREWIGVFLFELLMRAIRPCLFHLGFRLRRR